MEETTEIEGQEFVIVGQVGEYDYSWSIGRVLRDEDGNLFWGSDSGCSCTSYWENKCVADLTPIKSLAEAVELAKADDFSEWDVAEFAEHLLF